MHERLQEILRALFSDDTITLVDDTSPSDISGWDSLVTVNFLFAVEQEFKIVFSEEEYGQFETIGQLKEQLAAKGAPGALE